MSNENLSPIERCPTGIPKLDKQLEGGFPRRRSILLSGSCGTGKTIFGLQFLCQGALEYDEPGIFMSLEERYQEIRENVGRFGFGLKNLKEQNKIAVVDTHSKSKLLEQIVDIILTKAEEIGAKRVVIDSLSAMRYLSEIEQKERDIRETLLALTQELKNEELTSLLITETPDYQPISYGVESYVVDGIVVLGFDPSSMDSGRTLTIRKMRATNHNENIHPIDIVDGKGIKLIEE